MSDRMPLHRIDIPNPAHSAADVVITALRREGMDPRKAYDNPMMREVCQAWVRGEMDDAGFRRCCRNVMILNPSLRLG